MSNTDAAIKKFQKELNSGIAALVLLSVMDKASEPMYGYQIAKLIGAGSEDGLSMKQGALYPVLRSLENNSLLESRVEPSVSGPPRRYYNITDSGQKALARWVEIWIHTKSFVDNTLEGVDRD
ncbi:MAG: PadR family transcriptional regulator [Anaerolineaceae bacterium]|nr:PadR family transcriptional regulator [Anaerolineaceae bacterium]